MMHLYEIFDQKCLTVILRNKSISQMQLNWPRAFQE